jgi:hypothetical protein
VPFEIAVKRMEGNIGTDFYPEDGRIFFRNVGKDVSY